MVGWGVSRWATWFLSVGCCNQWVANIWAYSGLEVLYALRFLERLIAGLVFWDTLDLRKNKHGLPSRLLVAWYFSMFDQHKCLRYGYNVPKIRILNKEHTVMPHDWCWTDCYPFEIASSTKPELQKKKIFPWLSILSEVEDHSVTQKKFERATERPC